MPFRPGSRPFARLLRARRGSPGAAPRPPPLRLAPARPPPRPEPPRPEPPPPPRPRPPRPGPGSDGALPVGEQGPARFDGLARRPLLLGPVGEELRLDEPVRVERRVGGGERDLAGAPQVEERSVDRREVLVNRRDVVALRGEALGQAEGEQRVRADGVADAPELRRPGAHALDGVEGLGDEERLERRVAAGERLGDPLELGQRTARLVPRACASPPVLDARGRAAAESPGPAPPRRRDAHGRAPDPRRRPGRRPGRPRRGSGFAPTPPARTRRSRRGRRRAPRPNRACEPPRRAARASLRPASTATTRLAWWSAAAMSPAARKADAARISSSARSAESFSCAASRRQRGPTRRERSCARAGRPGTGGRPRCPATRRGATSARRGRRRRARGDARGWRRGGGGRPAASAGGPLGRASSRPEPPGGPRAPRTGRRLRGRPRWPDPLPRRARRAPAPASRSPWRRRRRSSVPGRGRGA